MGPTSGSLGDLGIPDATPVVASLDFSGTDAIITGSVGHLFESAGFVGPNRSEKSDRVRPQQDVLAVARSFTAIRAQLAAARDAVDAPEIIGQSRIETAEAAAGPRAPEDDEPRISVAAIDTSAALEAIDGIAPQSGGPVPNVASDQLAYARASAPITTEYATGEAMRVAERQLWCLSTAIYFEARGESYRGQVAVAQVVLNRVKDHRYPDTICSVVFQNQHRRNACQFSFACDGIPDVVNDRKSWAQAEEIAKKVTQGQLYLTEVADATHYHATYVRPAWAPRMNKVTQIGLHVFYKFKTGWRFG
jgi:spore germination cell wall hydrolase CwlJ-like protein